VTSPALEVETSLARLTGDADLHLRGTAAQPIVLGRIDIAEGTISFSGTQYQLDRGSIVFSNPVRILPVVDLQASARVRDYDITLSFHGPLDKLSITYRSDPPLPPSDIIALLALGRTRQDIVLNTSPQQQSFADVTSTQLLSNALNYAQSSRVQRLFGASRIKIDPEAAGPQNNGTSRLTLEQQVSNRATLTYITNLSQSAQTVIQLEFNINRQLSLVGIRDQNGVVSFSIYLRQRKR
jgi:translocation and assembly module TamB